MAQRIEGCENTNTPRIGHFAAARFATDAEICISLEVVIDSGIENGAIDGCGRP